MLCRQHGGTPKEGAAEAGIQIGAHDHEDTGAKRVTRLLDIIDML